MFTYIPSHLEFPPVPIDNPSPTHHIVAGVYIKRPQKKRWGGGGGGGVWLNQINEPNQGDFGYFRGGVGGWGVWLNQIHDPNHNDFGYFRGGLGWGVGLVEPNQ